MVTRASALMLLVCVGAALALPSIPSFVDVEVENGILKGLDDGKVRTVE